MRRSLQVETARPRRRARALHWLSIVVSLNLVAPPVFAQPKKPKTVREELTPPQQREWDAALALFGEKNWRGAIVQFQRMYDQTKNPRILLNIAVAEKEQGNYARSIRMFERMIAEGQGKLTKQELDEAKASIDTLKSFVSTLDVTTNVPGANISIDGEDVGTTPLAPVTVSVGSRAVRVTKDGFREQTKSVDIARGKPAALKVELVPERIMTAVTVTAEGVERANVRIDSIEMGPAPYKGQVEVGKRHKFEAYAPNYVTAEQSIDVPKQEQLNIVLRLSEARSEGRVAIIARPAGAIIDIDNKTVDTDKWDGVLAAGGHHVRIHKDGYIDHIQEVGVAPDQVRSIDITLRQDTARGNVYWAVGAALVVVGGTITGFLLSKVGREDSPTPGTFTPGVIPTWFHR
jgi:hypothetical protein